MNSTKLNTPADGLSETPTPDKRGRGRPRKYPIGESPSERLKAARENGLQRRRGRPRKVSASPNDSTTPAQVPLPNSASSKTTSSNSTDFTEKDPMLAHFDELEAQGLLGSNGNGNSNGGDGPLNSNTPTPVKRGRGRPPKSVKNGTSSTAVSPEQLQQQAQDPSSSVNSSTGDSSIPASGNNHVPHGSSNGKAKRGRPRKSQ